MCTATPPRGTRMWVPAKPPFLPSAMAGPSCSRLPEGSSAAQARIGEQRAGAAFDVDPAVAARGTGVGRNSVELLLAFVQVLRQRLQPFGALLEVQRQQRRAADAAGMVRGGGEVRRLGVRGGHGAAVDGAAQGLRRLAAEPGAGDVALQGGGHGEGLAVREGLQDEAASVAPACLRVLQDDPGCGLNCLEAGFGAPVTEPPIQRSFRRDSTSCGERHPTPLIPP